MVTQHLFSRDATLLCKAFSVMPAALCLPPGLVIQLEGKSSLPLPHPTRLMGRGKGQKVLYQCSVVLCNHCSGGEISIEPQFCLPQCTLHSVPC